MVGGTAIGGCRSSEPATNDSTEPSASGNTVPLRVLMVGDDQDAAAISRGWGAIAEKSLAIEAIPPSLESVEAMASKLLEGASKCDVLIYPLILVAQLNVIDALTPLSESESRENNSTGGDLYAALRGAARYSGEQIGVPVGAPVPALIAADGLLFESLPEDTKGGAGNDEESTTRRDSGIQDWQAYDQVVEADWKGMASEPTAPGWAGAMFLWRLVGVDSWLFDRETLEPLVTSDPYVAALAQMQSTHSKYTLKSQQPGAVWNAVASGELRGGIGFPASRNSGSEPSVVREMPGIDAASAVPLNPFTRLVSLSTNCRQSGSAKQFIRWISGGEGSAGTRSQVTGMTDTRIQLTASDSSSGASKTPNYDRYLRDRLASPITRPTLKIREGSYYYDVLDEQVRRALVDGISPEQALKAVYDGWESQTDKIGRPAQLRAWRRSQGMRG